ncbi:putative ATP-dependent DNA helicase PIF1, partial [Rhizoctonia solani 123E]
GMPVLVTANVETGVDVANGSRGIIDDIVVHGDEVTNDNPPGHIHEPPELHLKRPPACVLAKLLRTRAAPIGNLGEGVIPIVPTQSRFQLTVPGQSKKITICREQIPLIPAYAFTDYRGQGQTLPYVIIDMGKPPTGGFTPFNAYVALSRSQSMEQCRLLRDFDDKLSTQPPCPLLLAEDRRLEALNYSTQIEYKQSVQSEIS